MHTSRLFELADREDPSFQPAAARWHARFVLAAQLELGDAETMMNMLCGVKGANRLVIRRYLVEAVENASLMVREIAK